MQWRWQQRQWSDAADDSPGECEGRRRQHGAIPLGEPRGVAYREGGEKSRRVHEVGFVDIDRCELGRSVPGDAGVHVGIDQLVP